MGTLNIILLTLGILFLIEGIIVATLTKSLKKDLIKILKTNKIKKFGLIELVIAIILIIVSFLI